jgi:hypothetical protein
MAKKHMKSADGMYHIKSAKYQLLEGSRAQVWHKTAYKTAGGLTRDKLLMNKNGRVVSKKKHNFAKKDKRLQKYGYYTRKGKFGFVKKETKKTKKTRKTRKTKRK